MVPPDVNSRESWSLNVLNSSIFQITFYLLGNNFLPKSVIFPQFVYEIKTRRIFILDLFVAADLVQIGQFVFGKDGRAFRQPLIY